MMDWCGTPMKLITIFAARYAEVSSIGSYDLDFLARNVVVKHDLDFETKGYRICNVSFTTREL